jgi:hypothetical protein
MLSLSRFGHYSTELSKALNLRNLCNLWMFFYVSR